MKEWKCECVDCRPHRFQDYTTTGKILWITLSIILASMYTFIIFNGNKALMKDVATYCDNPYEKMNMTIWDYELVLFRLPPKTIDLLCDDKIHFVTFDGPYYIPTFKPEYYLRNIYWIPIILFQ